MSPNVEQLAAESIAVWQRGPACLPPLGRRFTAAEQSDREDLFDRFLAVLEGKLLAGALLTRTERVQAHARITSAFAEFARSAFDLEDRHLDLLLGEGFPAVGTTLGRLARRLDPDVGATEIFQACRSAWAACGLQALLGRPMRVTPAIFAYSMLYPYSDNYVDDATIPPDQKLRFSVRFRRRLEGENLPAADPLDKTIWKLVSLIESEYARAEYPEVYASLLAIHRAQEASIGLVHRSHSHGDVMPVVFAKGGASVLADAYLAAGRLTDSEARFAFDWGVLLQLGDDLQDAREESANGLHTVFSTAVAGGPIDELTGRTFHFAMCVMKRMKTLTKAPEALKDLLKHSSISLVLRAAGDLRDLYPASWIIELEQYSPFRFAFLQSRAAKIALHKSRLAKLFEAFLAGDEDESVFPTLAGSLLL